MNTLHDTMTDLLSTAYHEAGHAVVDYDYGNLAGSVTIVPDYEQGSAGASGHEVWFSQIGEWSSESEIQAAIEAEIIGLYAGLEAQRLAYPDSDSAGACSDYEKAEELAELQGWGTDELGALRQRAADHVARRWGVIGRLAQALVDLKTLDETQVMFLIEEMPFHTKNTLSSPLYTAHMSEEALQRYLEEMFR